METATETRTTTVLTVRAPEPSYETLDETYDEADARNDAASEEASDDDTEGSDSDAEDAEIQLYTSAPTTVRWGSQGYASSSSELRRTSSPVATDETDAQAAKPMLCTPTLMQRAAAASVSSSESHPTCLICLESLPSVGPARAPPVLVSNIPVRLVCNCTVHAHPACLARWLQRTLACPICHHAAQFQPRPGQVVTQLGARRVPAVAGARGGPSGGLRLGNTPPPVHPFFAVWVRADLSRRAGLGLRRVQLPVVAVFGVGRGGPAGGGTGGGNKCRYDVCCVAAGRLNMLHTGHPSVCVRVCLSPMRSLATLLLLAGIVAITIGYTKTTAACPPPRVEYR